MPNGRASVAHRKMSISVTAKVAQYIEELRTELDAASDSEVIRRAVGTLHQRTFAQSQIKPRDAA